MYHHLPPIALCALVLFSAHPPGIAADGAATVGGDLDLESIVSAHTDAVGLIHFIDVTIDFEAQNQPDTRAVKTPLTFSWRWSSQGDQERIRVCTDYFDPTADGRPTNLTDMYQDGRVRKVLQNYDPKNPQKITPLYQGTLRASTEPQTRSRPVNYPDPTPYLGLRVQFNDRELPRSLAEVRKEYQNVSLVGKLPYEDHFVWRIRAEIPGSEGKNYMEIDLDPTKNYHIRRFSAHNGSYKVTGGGEMPFDSVREVIEFHDGGNGVFIPLRFVERVQFHDGSSSITLHGTVTIQALNTAMPADAFNFQFPKYANVRRLPPVGKKVTVDIWGDDGPIFTANDLDEIAAFSRAQGLDTIRRGTSVAYPYVLGIVPLIVLLIGVIARGLRRKAKA